MNFVNTNWSRPNRILLLTYNRPEHISTTYRQGVIGVPNERANETKLKRMRVGDWVLIRVSAFEEFQAARPARITGRFIDQRKVGSPYAPLLWEEELELGRIVYPFRIPVSFEGGPHTKAKCVNWKSLASLGLRGKDGALLEDPQQWGIKFKTNVLDDPSEVDRFLDLLAQLNSRGDR